MAFSESQQRLLAGKLPAKQVCSRTEGEATLHYLEGWFAMAEANRIFGFDGWDRETLLLERLWSEAGKLRHRCAFMARVRIRVRAGDEIIYRDGTGVGVGEGVSPPIALDRAIKTAETDATKRALVTFGNRFGLCLYDRALTGVQGRRRFSTQTESTTSAVNGSAVRADPIQHGIDKSALINGAPRRLRDKEHLRRISGLGCLICGERPSHAHHLRFAQPRAMGRKVSDEFVVPLCPTHHQELHDHGDERAWWRQHHIEPLEIAGQLWKQRSVRGETA